MKARIAAKIAKAKAAESHELQPTERHFTPEEIAKDWGVDATTVRRAFRDVPGVLKIGGYTARARRRDYMKLRIPESVLRKVYAEMVR